MFAQEVEDPEEEAEEVYLDYVDPTIVTGPKKGPTLLPRVSYNAQNLYVWSAVTIDMLQVIIRDEDDNIIYNNVCMPLLPGSTTLILPSTVCTDKGEQRDGSHVHFSLNNLEYNEIKCIFASEIK